MTRWAIVANEYPPRLGGVSEYVWMVAHRLADAGDEVHVFTPPAESAPSQEGGIHVHVLPDYFGLRSLAALNAELDRIEACRIFLQYVPNAFGWKGFNLPFCLWFLMSRRFERWVQFHEVAFPWGPRHSLKHNLLGALTRMTASFTAHSCDRVFVSTPYWVEMLRSLAPQGLPITLLPMGSNAAAWADPDACAKFKTRLGAPSDSIVVGHYCTLGDYAADRLARIAPGILRHNSNRILLLIGRGSGELAGRIASNAPDIEGRLRSTGSLPPPEAAIRLAVCDVLVQPYQDGISSRRTTAMAALALGKPLVTTEGFLTEPLWRKSRAVLLAPAADAAALGDAVETVLSDPALRKSLGARAAALHAERFSLEKNVAALRSEAPVLP